MSTCPIFKSADLVGKKWTIVITQEVGMNGDKGFNYIFHRLHKISPKILSARLKELEHTGVIKREVIANHIPIKTRYLLTKKGKDLVKIFNSLKQWHIKYTDSSFQCLNKECVKCPLY